MIKCYLFMAALIAFSYSLSAQSPADMEFVPKGSICAGMGYNYNSWNHYWEGDTLRINDNVGTVAHQSVFGGFSLGIIDRVNLIVMLPYVWSNTSQGTLNGQSGFSDISINVKGMYGDWKLGPGTFKLGGNIGLSTPVSNYVIDFGPVNIGLGTTNFLYRQLISYKLDKGFYFDGRAAYVLRSNIGDISRGGFYYDEGEAYYANEVDMPDVFEWSLAAGFSNNRLLAEASFISSNCLEGSDIRTWDPGFPSNKMIASVVQGRFDYYFATPTGLNISAKVGYTVAGRNVGQSIYGNLSVNYLFPVWGKRHDEPKPVK
jgi:hypothetical protein